MTLARNESGDKGHTSRTLKYLPRIQADEASRSDLPQQINATTLVLYSNRRRNTDTGLKRAAVDGEKTSLSDRIKILRSIRISHYCMQIVII